MLIITKLKGIDVPPPESTNPHKGTNSQLMPMVNQQINNLVGSRVTTVVGRAQFPVVNQQINNYQPLVDSQRSFVLTITGTGEIQLGSHAFGIVREVPSVATAACRCA